MIGFTSRDLNVFFIFKQYFISQTKKDKAAGVSLYNVFSWD